MSKPVIHRVNGYTILFIKSKSKTAYVSSIIANGYCNETESDLGINHLLEHVLLESWKKCKQKSCELYWMSKPVQPSTSAMQHVFSKGAGLMGTCDSAKNQFSNNAPGLYLMDTNTLYILMDTVNQPACFPGMSNDIVITNMPINKWFNVVIRLTNDTLDVYINGRLTKRLVMTSVPNQNYDDVYICSGGGFNGYVSDLKYFNSSIGTTQINALVSNGPNTSINSSNLKNNIPPYLSIDWYDENQNQPSSS